MFNKTTILRHSFSGGWSTDFGPSVDVSPDASGKVQIPFLVEAQDCLFELDGGPHEIGGTSKVNASSVASGAVVTGIYDYWRQGALGSPARRRILHAGTTCLSDTDDGAFTTTLFSGLESGKVPSYCTFDDLLIVSSDSNVDVPKSWDQSTAQDLAGTPPNFAFCVSHKNRAWAAGVASNPSRLYYSVNVDPEDWAGAGSGTIDIDPNDGDVITGLVSHKDYLFVFKGPNKGSIHQILGSSPTGSDAFSRRNFTKGVGACWHNAIFPFGDDIGFVSQYGTVHSLSATAAYGDFLSASLSLPINTWIREHLNYNRIKYISAATDPLRGVVYITMPIDAATTNNVVLALDFRGAPDKFRWSRIPSYAMGSLGLFVDTSNTRTILGGGNDGYVRRLNVADRSIDGVTALSFKVTTPYMNYGDSFHMKTLNDASVGISPKGAFDFTFGWARDDNAQQTYTVAQGGTSVLAPAASGEFELDASVLGGASFVDRFMELTEGDEFRSIQYDISQAQLSADIEVHSLTAVITPGAYSTQA